MKEQEIVKEATKLAEEEIRNEEKMRIKGVIKATLEALRQKEERRHVLDEEIKILRKDVDDFMDGRIDRIKERQDLDPRAKDVSVIIIKEKIIERQIPNTWFVPWIIEVKPQYVPYMPTYVINGTISGNVFNNSFTTDNASFTFTTSNSMAHMHTGGTYLLENGTVKYL